VVAVALDVHRQLQRFERLPAQVQQEVRAVQLNRLAAHAERYSPFWRDRLAAALGKPLPGTVELSALPVLGRLEVQESFESMRARAPNWTADMVQPAKTSGSTGRPVQVERFRPFYWPLYGAIALADARWHRRDASLTMAVIQDVPDGDLRGWDDLWRALGKHGLCHRRNLIQHDPAALLGWLREVKPRYLYTAPTMARQLAQLALRTDARMKLAQIITFGETVDPELRRVAQEAFGAKVTDTYSCEELGWIALQCPRHDHYHVMSASVVVEIVDDEGRACAPGQPGRVLLTGLQSFAMPLIRYEVGDYAEWGGPCDCGITLPVIGRIWGRERSFIRLPDGSLRLARLTGEYWRAIAPIGEYRVLQYGDGLIEAFVTCERALSEAERDAMRAMLQKVLGYPFEVVVTQCEKIDWGSRWKREDVMRVDHVRGETTS
jgi:phenylacetate-CoA ligase